jgi:hypothetical protein
MTKEELKHRMATASSASAMARYMDMCISMYGWQETNKMISDMVISTQRQVYSTEKVLL